MLSNFLGLIPVICIPYLQIGSSSLSLIGWDQFSGVVLMKRGCSSVVPVQDDSTTDYG